MNSESDYREQFRKAEQEIGITKGNYQQKFIYQPYQNSENFLLDRFSATPSQLMGFSIEQQKWIGYLMSEMVFRACQSLRLPVSTAVVAASISHFFYSRVSFLDHDFRDVAMGAVFLACKSEETLRRSFEVSSVFDHIFKIFEGQKHPVKIQVLQSVEYEYMRKKVLELQKQILFEQGFEVYRLFDIPHRYIGGLFKSFEKHPSSKNICQQAWIYLNDFYRTNACLYYSGQIIAAASVYMSLLKLKIKMPTVPWWVLMEANIQSIEELVGELEYFYESSKGEKYTMDKVAGYISEVGERHELINVFPVNYYRKIILDINHQLKIPKKKLLPSEREMEEQIQVLHQENVKDDSSEDSSKKKKKKKDKKEKKDKKDKKKKKDKDKQRRYDKEERQKSDRSRSRDKRKSSISKSQRFSPDLDEQTTPKILKNEQNAKSNENPEPIKQQNPVENKESVRKLQIESKSDLLLKINSQLNKFKKPEKIEKKEHEQKDSDDDEEELMADLIKIKKKNIEKKLEA